MSKPQIQSNPNVSVICRFRPMNELEKTNGKEEVADFTSPTSLTFHSTKEKNNYKYNFDRIFPPSSTQQEVYDFGVKGIIDSVLSGYNGTVLAYGQTSSGKTYTMQGLVDNEVNKGIIPRMIAHVFGFIYDSPPEIEFMVKVSMIEIYQEKIRDLIETDKINLNVREDPTKGIFIEDISEHYVGSPDEVIDIMKVGTNNRAQACTNMNEHSSRSHSIFIMTVSQNNRKDGVAKTGKLYLVDLAGSEKISKTGATGHTLEEAKIINKSLTTLGMVINSLTDGKSTHIPYRESKLTRVLQESLGGNSKTCLIITCSPSIYNESETLSTLRFGERAKKIKNKPKINKEVTVAELQVIVGNLEEKLAKANRRIKQLEDYIKKNGLEVPPDESGEGGQAKEKKDTLKNIDEAKLLEEFKARMDNETISLTEKIIDAINTLKESEEGNEDKTELIVQLLLIKDNYQKKEKENLEEINNLKNELELVNKVKEKLQFELIEKESNEDEKSELTSTTTNTNSNAELSMMRGTCVEFINKIKQEAITKNNKELFTIINEFQDKIISQNNTKPVEEKPKPLNLKIVDNISQPIIAKKDLKDKDTQTEGYETEIAKVKEEFEKEKKIFFKTIDEKGERVCQLESDISELKDRYEILSDTIPFDSKKNHEKVLVLEKNLLDLKRKLQECQTQKLLVEGNNNKMLKILKEKCETIERLEKEGNELKEKNMLRSTMMANNVVRVIKGHGLRGSMLDPKMELGKTYVA